MKNYDDKKSSKYIMYLDANNLYAWAMSQCLPTGGFKWMMEKELAKVNIGKYSQDSKNEYPKKIALCS